MKTIAVVHYDEVALKGGNRRSYELALAKVLAQKIAEHHIPAHVTNRWGRIVIEPNEGAVWDEAALAHICENTPGVALYGMGVSTSHELSDIHTAVRDVAQYLAGKYATFKVEVLRVEKLFPRSSPELAKDLGATAASILTDARVDLTHPDAIIRVEILHNHTYVFDIRRGLFGLPVGTSGKAVALLSGGFDSPVAVHMCAVRGVRPVLVHFHAFPHTSRAALDKVEDLARVLRDVCGPITLYEVPLLEAQKAIALVAPERLRVVLYRRLMLRAAEAIAHKEKAKALVTGEAISQVASQTLENMNVIERATMLPVLRPVCGMNKKDIIAYARRIHTHDISVLPHDDTCTVFMPKAPEIRAKIADAEDAETRYDSDALIQDMLARMGVIKL